MQTIPCYSPSMKGLKHYLLQLLTSQSHDFQSSLRSALSKYTTLNTKEPTSTYSKQFSVPIVPYNSPITRSPYKT
jgi:hypothetical protein